jgi:hypothetical protein
VTKNVWNGQEFGCAVSVAGGAFSASAVQIVCVSPGAVTLLAERASSRDELGLWHDTSGDHGFGDPGMFLSPGGTLQRMTTVSVSDASACVWICCALQVSPGKGCPISNQCP